MIKRKMKLENKVYREQYKLMVKKLSKLFKNINDPDILQLLLSINSILNGGIFMLNNESSNRELEDAITYLNTYLEGKK